MPWTYQLVNAVDGSVVLIAKSLHALKATGQQRQDQETVYDVCVQRRPLLNGWIKTKATHSYHYVHNKKVREYSTGVTVARLLTRPANFLARA